MNRRLEGQVAIVTGAGQGIGQGIAMALAKDGAAVAIVGRTESKIVDTCELIHQGGGRAIPVVCDVTDVAQIDALCDHRGAVTRWSRHPHQQRAGESAWTYRRNDRRNNVRGT